MNKLDKGIRIAGLAAIIAGGGFMEKQILDLKGELKTTKDKVVYLANEVVGTDSMVCQTMNAVGTNYDCAGSMDKERQRFRDEGIDVPDPKPTTAPEKAPVRDNSGVFRMSSRR